MATMTLKKTQAGTMKAQLEDILMAVSWSELSRMPLATEGTQERLAVRSAMIVCGRGRYTASFEK